MARDVPASFEALRESPGFGMVILASDMAGVLEANLAAEEQARARALKALDANLAAEEEEQATERLVPSLVVP